MKTDNFTQDCDVTLDSYIEPSCCQERLSEDFGSGCFYFKLRNEMNHCEFSPWFYPILVMFIMLMLLICCCPVKSAIREFSLKHLRSLFCARNDGGLGGSDAKFEMKSQFNSVVDTDLPIDDTIEDLDLPKGEDDKPKEQCWTEDRSSTAIAEDLRPTAAATVAEVQIHSSQHPFAVDSSSDHQD